MCRLCTDNKFPSADATYLWARASDGPVEELTSDNGNCVMLCITDINYNVTDN